MFYIHYLYDNNNDDDDVKQVTFIIYLLLIKGNWGTKIISEKLNIMTSINISISCIVEETEKKTLRLSRKH